MKLTPARMKIRRKKRLKANTVNSGVILPILDWQSFIDIRVILPNLLMRTRRKRFHLRAIHRK